MKESSAPGAHSIGMAMCDFSATIEALWPDDIAAAIGHANLGIARTDDERSEIGRLRYELFVGRGGGRYRHADHAARTLLEPIDSLSLNFAGRFKDRCVVTIRATRANDALLDPQLEQVVAHAGLSPDDIDHSVVHSRLAVERSLSARSLVPALFRAMFRGACRADIRFCLAAVPSSVIPLLERFGFHTLERRRPYFDEAAGWMSVLILDLHDRRQLVRTHSPFLAIHDEEERHRQPKARGN